MAVLTGKVVGQTIPNNGFENWTLMPMWYEDPQSWMSNNAYLVIPVIKDTNAYSGNYSLRINYTWALAKGTATTKYAALSHPTILSLMVKADIDGADTVKVEVNIYNTGSIVDNGEWINTSDINSWTLINIPVSTTSAICDSVEIIITGGWNIGTNINVDNFVSESSVGLNELTNDVKFGVYPNPVNENFTIDNLNNIKQIEITDATGRIILDRAIHQENEIQLTLDSSGVYFIKAISDQGVQNRKIVISK